MHKTFHHLRAKCEIRRAYGNAVRGIRKLEFQENPNLGKVVAIIGFFGRAVAYKRSLEKCLMKKCRNVGLVGRLA